LTASVQHAAIVAGVTTKFAGKMLVFSDRLLLVKCRCRSLPADPAVANMIR